MKKVWITSILTILMLTVPITSVVSANEAEDCNCNPTINDSQIVRIERLLNRFESRINFILLRYGYIPEVAEKCEEMLNIINSWEPFDIICEILTLIMIGLEHMLIIFQGDLRILIVMFHLLYISPIWFIFCWTK